LKAISIYPVGENTLTVSLGNELDTALNSQVFKLYHYLRGQPNPFWLDLIPAYTTLTVVYDTIALRKHYPSAFEWVKNEAERALHACRDSEALPARKVRIPVCYDLAFGLDLKTLASKRKLSVDKVVELHTQQTYRVYMLGFLPGFAYMGFVTEKIAAPRLSSPRRHVPAGSVGIAGNQTGIYPLDSPGGWNIIGRTPVKLFDPQSESPTLLQPGDEVSFIPISKDEFESFDSQKFQIIRS
jgi:inhibitor of KinA